MITNLPQTCLLTLPLLANASGMRGELTLPQTTSHFRELYLGRNFKSLDLPSLHFSVGEQDEVRIRENMCLLHPNSIGYPD